MIFPTGPAADVFLHDLHGAGPERGHVLGGAGLHHLRLAELPRQLHQRRDGDEAVRRRRAQDRRVQHVKVFIKQ